MKSGKNLNRKKRRMKMNDEKQMITIDGKEYDFDELENNEQYLVNQIRDLNTKIAQAQFGMDQLRAAQDAFTKMLVASVNEPKTEEGDGGEA
jgi:inorganic pyrophosphatase/exopolyphosphatase